MPGGVSCLSALPFWASLLLRGLTVCTSLCPRLLVRRLPVWLAFLGVGMRSRCWRGNEQFLFSFVVAAKDAGGALRAALVRFQQHRREGTHSSEKQRGLHQLSGKWGLGALTQEQKQLPDWIMVLSPFACLPSAQPPPTHVLFAFQLF